MLANKAQFLGGERAACLGEKAPTEVRPPDPALVPGSHGKFQAVNHSHQVCLNEILNPKNTYMSKQTWLVCLQMPGRGRPRASPSTRSPNPCWGEGGSTSYILGRFLLKHLAVKRKHSYTIGVNSRRAGPLHPRILTHPGLSLRKSYNALQFGAFPGGSLDFM